MEEKDEWVFYAQIDWNCPKNNKFNVDTRDFHCGYSWKDKPHPDYSKISKYDHFFFTEKELKELLDRLFTESGGNGEWRYIELESKDNRVLNWKLKYLRIWRTDKGFIVCNSDEIAIPKHILSNKIDLESLNFV